MSKPNINIPAEFAINGTKTDFSQAKITEGFDRLQPDVLPGDNLNKFIDDTYKGLNGVLELFEGCVLYDSTVTYNNKSIVFYINSDDKVEVYRSLINNNLNNPLDDDTAWKKVELGGSGYEVGDIVIRNTPTNDAGKHLLDGALIQYGSYQAFVDYIADLYNNTPVEDVYNVNIVGSLTNNNGVLSGFSASDYAELPQDWGTFTTLELVIKANISTFEQASNIVAPFYTYTGLELAVDSDRTLVLRVGNGSSWIINNNSSQLLNLNTDYFFKVTHNSGVYTVDVSIDNESWTNYITVSSTQLPTGKILLGQAFVGNGPTQYFLRGSIDLNESYININGERWWSGKSERRAGFLTEDEWQQAVATYGFCGKYVYDSVNNTVRLPKYGRQLNTKLDSTAQTIYNGSPVTMQIGVNDLNKACFYLYSGTYSYGMDGYNEGSGVNNPIYTRADGDYENVGSQPILADLASASAPVDVYYYIVTANSTKTDIQVDIDEIATDLNGKADVDLTNVNDSGTSKGAGWAMPSSTYIDLALGASGTTYTAPANGWVWNNCSSSANNGITALTNITKGYSVSIRGSAGTALAKLLPVAKGDIFNFAYDGATTNYGFRFYYAQGSESEAN